MSLINKFQLDYLNPVHAGYPAWPSGERWLELYDASSDGTQVVVTRGLSNGSDSLYELYLETDDRLTQEEFSSSWQGNLVYEAGRVIPNVPNLTVRLIKNSYMCLQVQIDGAPPDWSLDDLNGNIGLFMGLGDQDLLAVIAPPAIPLNIKLMRPAELAYSIQHDDAGRRNLARLYEQQGDATLYNIYRRSVIWVAIV